MELMNGMFAELLAFAYHNNVSYTDSVKILDILVLEAEFDIEDEWAVAQFLDMQKGVNAIFKMLPINQWEQQYNLYSPGYKVFLERHDLLKSYRAMKLKNYNAHYPEIVKIAAEYKKQLTMEEVK